MPEHRLRMSSKETICSGFINTSFPPPAIKPHRFHDQNRHERFCWWHKRLNASKATLFWLASICDEAPTYTLPLHSNATLFDGERSLSGRATPSRYLWCPYRARELCTDALWYPYRVGELCPDTLWCPYRVEELCSDTLWCSIGLGSSAQIPSVDLETIPVHSDALVLVR